MFFLSCFGGGPGAPPGSEATPVGSPQAQAAANGPQSATVHDAAVRDLQISSDVPEKPAAEGRSSPGARGGQRHRSKHGSSSRRKKEKEFDMPLPNPTAATDPTIGQGNKLDGINLLSQRRQVPGNQPDLMHGVRPMLRIIQTFNSPEEMLWDVDDLTLIHAGKSSLILHGSWQAAEVAVKITISKPKFSLEEPALRDAMLGLELSHPNLVRIFTARLTQLVGTFINVHAYTDSMRADAEYRLAGTASAQLPKSLYRNSFDSEEGFGPPPFSYRVQELAHQSRPHLPLYWNEDIQALQNGKAPSSCTPQPDSTNADPNTPSTHPTTQVDSDLSGPPHSATDTTAMTVRDATGRAPDAVHETWTGNGLAEVTIQATATTAPTVAPLSMSEIEPVLSPPLPSISTAAVAPAKSAEAPADGDTGSAKPKASRARRPSSSTATHDWRRPEHMRCIRDRLPWTGGLTWAHIMSVLDPPPGATLVASLCEYCELGTLSEAIHVKKIFRGVTTRGYNDACVPLRALIRSACDMTLGLLHLHKIGVIHGDFKTSSLLLTGSRADRRGYRVKLADYGKAQLINTTPPPSLKPNSINSQSIMKLKGNDRGTIPYIAPETLAGFLSKESDVYSLGLVLWEMCHSQVPFAQYSEAEFIEGILGGHLQLTCSPSVPQRLTDLIGRCLQLSPACRPSCAEILCVLNKIEADLREEIHQVRMQQKPDSRIPGAPRLAALSAPMPAMAAIAQANAASRNATSGTAANATAASTNSHGSVSNGTAVVTPSVVLHPQLSSQESLVRHLNEQLQVQHQQLAQLAASVAQQPQPQVIWQQTMPPPRNHWPQLQPLLVAPKHVTFQNQPRTPPKPPPMPDNGEPHANLLETSEVMRKTANVRTDSTIKITPTLINDLLERGRILATEKAREEMKKRKEEERQQQEGQTGAAGAFGMQGPGPC